MLNKILYLTFPSGENFLCLFAMSISFFDLHTNSNSGNVQFQLKHYKETPRINRGLRAKGCLGDVRGLEVGFGAGAA